jgi:predicted dehydrogenase
VHAEFVQDLLITTAPTAKSGWRLDPARAGAGSSADVGTHALHLVEFVTGLHVDEVRTEFHSSTPGQALEDAFFTCLRCEGGVPGTLWGTPAATGVTSGPRLRIFGEQGSLSWGNAAPQELVCQWADAPTQAYTRGFGRGIDISAERMSGRGRGNVEGWLEAWTTLYVELALAISAWRDGTEVPDGLLGYPTLEDEIRGVRFIAAAAASNSRGGEWIAR